MSTGHIAVHVLYSVYCRTVVDYRRVIVQLGVVHTWMSYLSLLHGSVEGYHCILELRYGALLSQ